MPSSRSNLDRVEHIERKLWGLLLELEEANGDNPTKLEHLLRFAWDEARAEVSRLKAPRAGWTENARV